MPTELFLVFYQRVFSRIKSIHRLSFDMTRLFCNLPLSIGATLDLPEEKARHVSVLRLSAGENVTLFDGKGGQYQAKIIKTDRKRTTVEILSFVPEEMELPYTVILAQALPEAGKMDWIVEKAVELGVKEIIPVAAQRSVVRLNADRTEKRMARWRSLIVSAAEQCGRNTLSVLGEPVGLAAFLKKPSTPYRLLFSPRGKTSLAAWAVKQIPQSVTLLIGPEGGFSPEEEELALQNGVTLLSMGPRVLRTETAGLAAVSALNALWEAASTHLLSKAPYERTD